MSFIIAIFIGAIVITLRELIYQRKELGEKHLRIKPSFLCAGAIVGLAANLLFYLLLTLANAFFHIPTEVIKTEYRELAPIEITSGNEYYLAVRPTESGDIWYSYNLYLDEHKSKFESKPAIGNEIHYIECGTPHMEWDIVRYSNPVLKLLGYAPSPFIDYRFYIPRNAIKSRL